jgi:hypothetical protein
MELVSFCLATHPGTALCRPHAEAVKTIWRPARTLMSYRGLSARPARPVSHAFRAVLKPAEDARSPVPPRARPAPARKHTWDLPRSRPADPPRGESSRHQDAPVPGVSVPTACLQLARLALTPGPGTRRGRPVLT